MQRRWLTAALAALVCLAGPAPARADTDAHDCDKPDFDRRIQACTELIENPSTPPGRLATAYANRALSHSVLGRHETAIRDYDRAIAIVPDFAVALNNRAWAYFKWGKAAQGMPDVQKSLRLDPTSEHALDTRAHIKQWTGDISGALVDYEAAMTFGGPRMITLYQCGLKMHRVYDGPIDGVRTPAVRQALRVCVNKGSACDPLPPEEECRDATS